MTTRRTRRKHAAVDYSDDMVQQKAPKTPRTATKKAAPASKAKSAAKKSASKSSSTKAAAAAAAAAAAKAEEEEAILVMIKPRKNVKGKDKVVLLSEGVISPKPAYEDSDDDDDDDDDDQIVMLSDGAVVAANENSDDDFDDDGGDYDDGADYDDDVENSDSLFNGVDMVRRLLLSRNRRVLYELAAVLGGTAIAFATFEEDMRAFGLCVVLGMIYMVWTCPDLGTSLVTAAVAGAIGVGTEQWGCSNNFWNWVAPEFQPAFKDKPLRSIWMLDILKPFPFSAGSEGFPVEVVVAYAGAGFWMGSIATRLLAPELASEAADAATNFGRGVSNDAPVPWRWLVPRHWGVGCLQVACAAVLWCEKPWQQSCLMACLGLTVLSRLRTRRALAATLFWGAVVTGLAGFFFEVYATGGVDESFAVWRYDRNVVTAASSSNSNNGNQGAWTLLPPVPFFRTAPLSAYIGYAGSGLCIFGAAFLRARVVGHTLGTALAEAGVGYVRESGGGAAAAAADGSYLSGTELLAKWKRGLFTHEDKDNLHKCLGLYCLLHFLYRFAHTEFSFSSDGSGSSAFFGAKVDMNFGGHNGPEGGAGSWASLLSLVPHALLSASSLIFRIPKRRIKEGSRIWPEYRLHSIAFAYRSLACMALTWVEARYLPAGGAPFFLGNAAIVLLTMAAADAGTAAVGKDSASSTINDLSAPAALKFYFSVAQFHATAGCLVGLRRYSTQLVYLWIIQVTAFLMTLRRKNLLPHAPLVYTYGLMLAYGMFVACAEGERGGALHMTMTLAAVAALLRMGLGMNKYAVWTITACIAHFARMTVEMAPPQPPFGFEDPHRHAALAKEWGHRWPYLNVTGIVALTLLGLYKLKHPRVTAASEEAAAAAAAGSK